MESKSFLELKYRIWNNYFDNLIIDKDIEFNWERRLPVGRSKFEHYYKAGTMLADLIKANVGQAEATILIIPAHFVQILIFADTKIYERADSCTINGAYQCGILNGIAVVVDPTIPADDNKYMLLLDLAENKAIRIVPGKYDYDTDLAEVIEQLKEADMEANIAFVKKLAKLEAEKRNNEKETK